MVNYKSQNVHGRIDLILKYENFSFLSSSSHECNFYSYKDCPVVRFLREIFVGRFLTMLQVMRRLNLPCPRKSTAVDSPPSMRKKFGKIEDVRHNVVLPGLPNMLGTSNMMLGTTKVKFY